MRIAQRIASLPSYVFAEAGSRIAALREKGIDVINLGIGSPDLAPPRPIIETLYESALQPDAHGYGGYYGTPTLRKAMAAYYKVRFSVELDPNSEVLPLIGSKEGIANVHTAFVDPGDIVIVSDPGYPTYRFGAMLAGGQVYPVPLKPEKSFQIDLAAVPPEIAERAKILWVNYPNNPTGAVADVETLQCCISFAREFDILLCYDNPYCDLTFDGYVAPSILEFPEAKEVAIEFNSLSKTYNMAGWRIGMAVGSAKAIEALATVKTNVDSGIFKPIQIAATMALTGDQSWIKERNEIYRRRRDVVLDFLPKAGMSAEKPKGGLYVWARVPAGYSSVEYHNLALEKVGVWVTPGIAFGDYGEGYVRISLTLPEEKLREAGERLGRL